eukprot:751765-Hanusia_phi.AAC.4
MAVEEDEEGEDEVGNADDDEGEDEDRERECSPEEDSWVDTVCLSYVPEKTSELRMQAGPHCMTRIGENIGMQDRPRHARLALNKQRRQTELHV